MRTIFKKTGVLICVIVIIAASFGIWGWSHRNSQPQSLEHVIIGYPNSPGMALLMVGKDKGFFQDQGLDVETKEFSAGKLALQAFWGGSLDFCLSGEFPLSLAGVNGNKFVVPAQMVSETKSEIRIVARKDANLNDAESYFKAKKRKLATSIGGGPEYYVYQLMQKYSLPEDQVEVVNMNPGEMPIALASGSIDAIAVFEPYAYLAEKQLNGEAISFSDPSLYSELFVMSAKTDMKDSPDKLEKLLKGFLKAEKYTAAHPEEAKEIVMAHTKLDKAVIDGIWDNFTFRLTLTKSLPELWNDEAAWAKSTGKISQDAVIPDYNKFIFPDSLRKIAPLNIQL